MTTSASNNTTGKDDPSTAAPTQAAVDLDWHESMPADAPIPNVSSLCPRLKLVYEKCFQNWYTTQFLTGESSELPCEHEYARYQYCVKQRMDPNILKEVPELDRNNPGQFKDHPTSKDTKTK